MLRCTFRYSNSLSLDSPEIVNSMVNIMSGGPSDTHVLQFVTLDGREAHFRIKKNTRIMKAMKRFSERLGQPFAILRFYFERTQIKRDDTPLKLQMKTRDYIHVLNKTDTNHQAQAKFLKSKLKSEKKKAKNPYDAAARIKFRLMSSVK